MTLSPSATTVYGAGIGADGLGNSALGGANSPLAWSIRVRIEQPSPLVSFMLPYIGTEQAPAYGAGTGGRLRYTLHADGAGLPGAIIGSPRNLSPSAKTNPARPFMGWPSVPLRAGMIVHIVFENIDADPLANYCSINNLVRMQPDERRMQPRWPDSDFANGYWHNGAWHIKRHHTPIIDIAYANGAHQSQPFGEANYPYPGHATESLVGTIGPGMLVRERWTHHGPSVTVGGVSLRALRSPDAGLLSAVLGCAKAYPLSVATFPPSSIVVRHAPTIGTGQSDYDTGPESRWARAALDRHATLTDGTEYTLEFVIQRGSVWTWPIRRSPGYHSDWQGVAEYSTDDGRTWKPLGRTGLGDCSLHAFFTTGATP